jgi:hypothetical protein
MMDPKESGPQDPFHPTPEEIKAYYEKAKREFSEADLKKFFVEEEGQQFSELVAELEAMVQQAKSKGNGNDRPAGSVL